MRLRTIIADDERIARQRLRRMLEKEDDVEIVAECADGRSTVDAVRKQQPDLLLLDIQMPVMDGFDVIDALGTENQPAVVFVTAFDKHAVQAFDTCALAYLLKPVAAPRLTKTLQRVREYLTMHRKPGATTTNDPALPRFAVRSGPMTTFVSPQEIDWIEADGNYAILHVGERNHLLRETMSALETRLPTDEFARVSRSAFVRLKQVREIRNERDGHHFAILANGARVLITRKVREVENLLRRTS